MVFLFRSEFFFGQLAITLGYMTKTLNQIFFPSTKIRIFSSATMGIRIFFQKKNITPPWKLNGPSLSNTYIFYKKLSFDTLVMKYCSLNVKTKINQAINQSINQSINHRNWTIQLRVAVIAWQLYLQLPMQSVPITTDVVGSTTAQGEEYNIM